MGRGIDVIVHHMEGHFGHGLESLNRILDPVHFYSPESFGKCQNLIFNILRSYSQHQVSCVRLGAKSHQACSLATCNHCSICYACEKFDNFSQRPLSSCARVQAWKALEAPTITASLVAGQLVQRLRKSCR